MQVDSTFRNRVAFPNPASFEASFLPGRASEANRLEWLDPASPMSYDFLWTGHAFDDAAPGPSVAARVAATTDVGTLSGLREASHGRFAIELLLVPDHAGGFRDQANFYRGASALVGGAERRRVVSSTLVATDLLRVRLLGPRLAAEPAAGVTVVLEDPTRAADGLWFVPNGPRRSNAFAGHYLYNETRHASARIEAYDCDDAVLKVSPPSPGWADTDNVGIVKEPPLRFVAAAGASTKNVPLLGNVVNDASLYEGAWLYVPAARYSNATPAGVFRRIVLFSVGRQEAVVAPALPAAPLGGDPLLVWTVPLDHAQPVINLGTLASGKRELGDCQYELDVASLTLPNVLLRSGGYLSDNPYVTLEVQTLPLNESSHTPLPSNAPHLVHFVLPVPNDITQREAVRFITLANPPHGPRTVIQWKPQSTGLLLRVRLPGGDLFETFEPDAQPPFRPKAHLQTNLVLSILPFRDATLSDKRFLVASSSSSSSASR